MNKFITEKKNEFENIYELIEIYKTLPTNNANTERCIKAMNFIHNEIRNRLLETNVDDLLMIYLNG